MTTSTVSTSCATPNTWPSADYPNPGAPYTVRYGWRFEGREQFAKFVDALRFYAKQGDAELHGVGYDCESDGDGFFCFSTGLTDEESEWVELVDGGERVPDEEKA